MTVSDRPSVLPLWLPRLLALFARYLREARLQTFIDADRLIPVLGPASGRFCVPHFHPRSSSSGSSSVPLAGPPRGMADDAVGGRNGCSRVE